MSGLLKKDASEEKRQFPSLGTGNVIICLTGGTLFLEKGPNVGRRSLERKGVKMAEMTAAASAALQSLPSYVVPQYISQPQAADETNGHLDRCDVFGTLKHLDWSLLREPFAMNMFMRAAKTKCPRTYQLIQENHAAFLDLVGK